MPFEQGRTLIRIEERGSFFAGDRFPCRRLEFRPAFRPPEDSPVVNDPGAVRLIIHARIFGEVIQGNPGRFETDAVGTFRPGHSPRGLAGFHHPARMQAVSERDPFPQPERRARAERLPLVPYRQDHAVIAEIFEIRGRQMRPLVRPAKEPAAVMPPVVKVKDMKFAVEKSRRHITDPDIQSFGTPAVQRLPANDRFGARFRFRRGRTCRISRRFPVWVFLIQHPASADELKFRPGIKDRETGDLRHFRKRYADPEVFPLGMIVRTEEQFRFQCQVVTPCPPGGIILSFFERFHFRIGTDFPDGAAENSGFLRHDRPGPAIFRRKNHFPPETFMRFQFWKNHQKRLSASVFSC